MTGAPVGSLVYAPPLDEGRPRRGGVVLGVTAEGAYICLDPAATGVKVRNVRPEAVAWRYEAPTVMLVRLARLVAADLAAVMAARAYNNPERLTKTECHMLGWLDVLVTASTRLTGGPQRGLVVT